MTGGPEQDATTGATWHGRFRLELIIAATVVILIVIGAGISIGALAATASKATRQNSLAQQVAEQNSELTALRTQYLLTHEENTVQQWTAIYESLTAKLDQLIPASKAEKDVLAALKRNNLLRKSLFDQIVATYGVSVSGKTSVAEAQQKERQLVATLLGVAESVNRDAATYEILTRNRSITTQHTDLNVTLVLVGVIVFGVGFILLWVGRRVLGSVTQLKAGTEAVAGGDLDYRMDIRQRDEFGDLARDFNAMTGQLKEYRDGLERKVADRTAELAHANRELALLNLELEGYARTVSHDLRGPLSNIGVSVQLLAEASGQPDVEALRSEAIETSSLIDRSLKRSYALIDDLLALARASQMPAEIEDVEVTDLVSEILAEQRPEMEKRGIKLEVDADLGRVRAGRTHMYQLFSNIIANGVRHNDAAEPLLRIQHMQDGSEDVHCYSICDNGTGIPPEDLENVFIPFFKSGTGADTGIGLAIAQKVITVYCGEIRVYNDDGACFEFWLRDLAAGTDD